MAASVFLASLPGSETWLSHQLRQFYNFLEQVIETLWLDLGQGEHDARNLAEQIFSVSPNP
jgi:hypothetical protein